MIFLYITAHDGYQGSHRRQACGSFHYHEPSNGWHLCRVPDII